MITQTRHLQLVGAHVRGYNARSIGVCYEGGLDEHGNPADTRTEEQRKSLSVLLRRLKRDYPHALILGHRDLPSVAKVCPCFDAQREYSNL